MAKYSGTHRGNIEFAAGDDASELKSVTGSVYVQQGATFTAPVLAKTGSVYVQQGATFTAPVLAGVDVFYEIADSGYTLYANSEQYKAGCRGPWSAKKALVHWNRTDVRAVDFTAAIVAHEAAKQVVAA